MMKNRSVPFAAMAMLVAAVAATGPSHAHEAPRLVEYLPGVAQVPGGAKGARVEFSSIPSETLDALRDDPSAAALRVGMANPDAVRNARALSLALPGLTSDDGPGQVVSFGALEISERSEHDYSVYGRDAATQSEVSLVVMGQDVVGTVTHGGDTWDLRPLGGGLTAVYRRDHSRFPPGSECGVSGGHLTPAPREPGIAPKRGTGIGTRDDDEPFPPDAGASTAPADSGDVIDVLVAYTPSARTRAGNIDALIRLFFDDTNRYFANSLIQPRVRLVHSYQVDYRQANDGIHTDLDRLRAHDDGYMDEIHAKRNQYGADLVAVLIGRRTMYCGVANIYHGREDRGFSVTAQECGSYTFAHELGHNLGAHHDPGTNMLNDVVLGFPYGQGLCNHRGNWRTVMSYNFRESCRPRVPYFSNPSISYRGTPTGDEQARHNVRVINETAFHIANFRTKLPPRHSIPLVMSADNAAQQGFLRIINRSRRRGTVRIDAFDDNGHPFGPAYLSLEARETRHFNSTDLERGNPSKGLSNGVGNGSGNWRLDLTTDLDIRTRAYVRTSDGFLTSIHEVAAEEDEGSMRYRVPTFNPGKNANQESRLRLINVGDGPARATISGLDDQGEPASGGSVRLTLPAKAAKMLSARELEQGGAQGISGRLEAGRGKWQLSVSSDQPLQVMSLLFSRRTGNLTNLSR